MHLLSPILEVLQYLFTLKQGGVSLSSVKVHLVAITGFHSPVKEFLVFAHPATSRFIKGLINCFPNFREFTSTWNLHFCSLFFHETFLWASSYLYPFKPFNESHLWVAITSPWRVGELGFLMTYRLPAFTLSSSRLRYPSDYTHHFYPEFSWTFMSIMQFRSQFSTLNLIRLGRMLPFPP